MTDQRENSSQQGQGGATAADRNVENPDEGLEAEQESAAAMDADVPQPPDTDKTTEGQPS